MGDKHIYPVPKAIKEFMYKWGVRSDGVKILITHTDLDGVGCAVLSNWYLNKSDKIKKYRNDIQGDGNRYIIFANYDNIDEVLDNISIFPHREYYILITDISAPYEKLQRFAESQNVSTCILDHHQTCPDYPNTENFMSVKETGCCASWLVYKGILHKKDKHIMRGFASAINKWDLGNWGSLFVKNYDELGDEIKLQMIYSTLYDKYNGDCYKIFEELLTYTKASAKIAECVYKSLNPIKEVYDELDNAITDITHPVLGKGALIYMPNPLKYFSFISKEFLSENIGYRYTICVDQGSVHMHGSDLYDLNLGEFCKKYGGGGHPKAAGVSNRALEEIGFV